MNERPLALFRRYLWENKNIIFVYTNNADKLVESRSIYNSAASLGLDETTEQQNTAKEIIISAALAAETQMIREMWGWTLRLPFKDWGVFCGVEADGSICCRMTRLKPEAAKDVLGAVAVQRVTDGGPVRQSMLIPRDTTVRLIVEQYFDESEQLPARLALHENEALLALSMPDAHWNEIASLAEADLLKRFHELLQDQNIHEEKNVEDEAEKTVAQRVRAQYEQLHSGTALSHGDLKCTHEAVFFYDCRCNEEQMKKVISTLSQAHQDELWKDTDHLEIECPRCGRKHIIKK